MQMLYMNRNKDIRVEVRIPADINIVSPIIMNVVENIYEGFAVQTTVRYGDQLRVGVMVPLRDFAPNENCEVMVDSQAELVIKSRIEVACEGYME